jgi:uncharacterized repeat protein (TIGR04138 family)
MTYRWEIYSFLKYIFIYLNKNAGDKLSPVNLNIYVQTLFKLLNIHFGLNSYAVLKYWGVKCFFDIAEAIHHLIKLNVIGCNSKKFMSYIQNNYSLYNFLKKKYITSL